MNSGWKKEMLLNYDGFIANRLRIAAPCGCWRGSSIIIIPSLPGAIIHSLEVSKTGEDCNKLRCGTLESGKMAAKSESAEI